MTMVVGMHLGRYVLIVADTRITYHPAEEQTRYEDGRTKIYRTKLGLVSGAGGVGLLDAVRLRLCGPEGDALRTFDDIHRIIDDERALRTPEESRDDPLPEIHPARAAWLFSYVNPKAEENQRLRLGVMTAGDDRSRILLPGECHILFPTGISEGLANSVASVLEENMRPDAQHPGGDGSLLEHNVLLARELIRVVAEKVPGVSSDSFQVGIQTDAFMWTISDVVKEGNGTFSLTLLPGDTPWPEPDPSRPIASLPDELLPALRAHLEVSNELETALDQFLEEADDFATLVESDQDCAPWRPTALAMRGAADAMARFRSLLRTVNELGAPLSGADSTSKGVDACAMALAIPAAGSGAKDVQAPLVNLGIALKALPPNVPAQYAILPVAGALGALVPLIRNYSESLEAFRRTEAENEVPGEG